MALPYDVDGTWVDSGASYAAGELRRADAAMFSSAGISSGLAVSVDGSDVVTIQMGQAVISGEDAVAGTGVYRAGIPAAVTGSLAARDATNPRIDLVVFRQLDTDVVSSHTARTSRIEIIAGTPSATPAVPTKPSMAVELARITVPASGGAAASVDSSNRVYAAAAGYAIASAAGGGSIGTGNTTFASLTLAAGRWALTGKGYFDWSIASTGESATAELYDGTSVQDTAVVTYPALNAKAPFALVGVVELASQATLTIRARTSGLDGTQTVGAVVLMAVRS